MRPARVLRYSLYMAFLRLAWLSNPCQSGINSIKGGDTPDQDNRHPLKLSGRCQER